MHDEVLIDGVIGWKSPGVSKRFQRSWYFIHCTQPFQFLFCPLTLRIIRKIPKHNLSSKFNASSTSAFFYPAPYHNSRTSDLYPSTQFTKDKYKSAKAELQQIIPLSICRPSSRPWTSPLHVGKKPDGSLRPCGNYHSLNSILKISWYCKMIFKVNDNFLHLYEKLE